MSEQKLYLGDCLEILPKIPDSSVDLVLCDLPYGTSVVHKWNKSLPIERLWEQYNRIIKRNGVICLFGTQPFSSFLVCSNPEMYRYMWFWKKENPTGFLNANYKPLNAIEEIVVFSKATVGSLSKFPIPYHPPTLKTVNKTKRNRTESTWREAMGYTGKNNVLNSGKEYSQRYTGYPTTILEYPREKHQVHPTQKPTELLEFLIETYTDENDLVLDNCMGSGSTGVACQNTNRSFIGIEKENRYYEIALKRIIEKKLKKFQKNSLTLTDLSSRIKTQGRIYTTHAKTGGSYESGKNLKESGGG